MAIRHVVAFMVLAFSAVAEADKATATAAYNEGKRLMKEGKALEACPKFEASYREDPQLGVLLNLADCHEVIGRLASAWVEFEDAAELAAKIGDAREEFARNRAAALLIRVPKLKILPPATSSAPLQGLVVRRGGADVTTLLGDELPVDPGSYTITAEAPGFAQWSTTLTIDAASGLQEIQIPALTSLNPEPEPKLEPEPKPDPTPVVPVHVTSPEPAPNRTVVAHSSSSSSPSKALPIALTVGSVALLGSALGFSVWGDRIYADAELEGDDERQLDLWHQAETRRYVAQGLVAGGVVVGAVAVWAWLRDPGGTRAPDDTVVRASVGPSGGLVTVGGAW